MVTLATPIIGTEGVFNYDVIQLKRSILTGTRQNTIVTFQNQPYCHSILFTHFAAMQPQQQRQQQPQPQQQPQRQQRQQPEQTQKPEPVVQR